VRSVRITLGVAAVLTLLAVGLVLSGSPVTVAGTNSVPVLSKLGSVKGGERGCQPGGTVPAGTSAVRLSLAANTGPRVSVTIDSGTTRVTHGAAAAGWGIAESVTVPVQRVRRAVANTRLCLSLGPAVEPVVVNGAVEQVTTAAGSARNFERFRIEYLRPGRESWWSLASSVARRMGLGHAPSGTWIVFAELALMLAVAGLAAGLVLRFVGRSASRAVARTAARAVLAETPPSAPPLAQPGLARWPTGARRRAARGLAVLRLVPGAAWTCALIACLNAVCWSLITPPFQLPDEPAHFAYVQRVAEDGALPTSDRTVYSPEEQVALADLHQRAVRSHPEAHGIVSVAEHRRLEHDLAAPADRSGKGNAGEAATEPPLYYALEAIPYGLASSGSLLDRLELMRVLSALMAGLTALFVYLFLREALPAAPWAWAVGGSAAALAPLLGFMSGAVNPDALLFTASAALFYCFAATFRRGLTPRLAVAIGAVTAIGLLTKLNFTGLLPGVALGLVLLAAREARASRSNALRCLALGLGIAAIPPLASTFINPLSHHPGAGVGSTVSALTSGGRSLSGEISYIWQLYLPRLPGMHVDFPGIFPAHQIWFDRSVGLYGWLDTPFPRWVDTAALALTGVLAALCIRSLVAGRALLWSRVGELAVYAVMAAGIMVLTGAASYGEFPLRAGGFGEPRYMLPLLALGGALLALSARGAGRRWGPTVGALVVALFFAHDLFSQLQVITRFYG
jgi:hypothetical protein